MIVKRVIIFVDYIFILTKTMLRRGCGQKPGPSRAPQGVESVCFQKKKGYSTQSVPSMQFRDKDYQYFGISYSQDLIHMDD